MKNIEVQFLSRAEMDDARKIDPRYKEVDDSNLGFSDPVKNRVYVLASKDIDLTKYLVNHEIEHLFEEEGTHEDSHGIRHKKFFKDILAPFSTNPGNIFGGAKGGVADFASAALPIIGSAINPLLGAGLSAAESVSKKIRGPEDQAASYQGPDFNSLFNGQQGAIPQLSQASLGQGFAQTGSFSPSGIGGGAGGTQMANAGLSALPGSAGISMGQQGGGQDQRQSGFWNPTYRF